MTLAAEPIKDNFSQDLDETLDLRGDFQRMLAVSEHMEAQLSFELKAFRSGFAEFMEQFHLYEVLKIERRPGETRLTLANLWRLTRIDSQPKLILHTFDLAEGCWREQDPAEITWRRYANPRRGKPLAPKLFLNTAWPDLHCFYWRRGNPGFYVTLLACLAEKVLAALKQQKKLAKEILQEIRPFGDFLFGRFMYMPYKIPVQAIEAALNRHIWDQELLSLVASLHKHSGGAAFISQYLEALPWRADLTRISRESPNFLPVLNLIPPELWSRPDLLADKVLQNSGPAFQNVPAGALRWLRKAPAETLGILHWCFKLRPDSMPKLIEVLAGLNPPAPLEIQWVVFPKICYLVDNLAPLWADKAELIKRLARLLTRHFEALWAGGDRSPAALKELRKSPLDITVVLDWLRVKGFKQGLPDKNSTWLSLSRRSEEYLERSADFQNMLAAVTKKTAEQAPDLADGCRELVEKYRLYEILKVERQPGQMSLTLANLWRLTRFFGRPGLVLHAFDLAEGRWREQDQMAIVWRNNDTWSEFDLYLDCYRENRFRIINKFSPRIWPDLEISNPGSGWRGLYGTLLGALVEKLLYALGVRTRHEDPEEARCFTRSLEKWFLDKQPNRLTTRVIHSALLRHICRDEDLLQLLQPVRGDMQVHLSHYLAAQPHKPDLARLSRESPNFLPLLNLIPTVWWSQRDLLQDKVLKSAGPAFRNFTPAGLRWLRQTQAETLALLPKFFDLRANDNCLKEDLILTVQETITIMAEQYPRPGGTLGKLSRDLVLVVIWRLLRNFDLKREYSMAEQRLARLLARHAVRTALDGQGNQPDLSGEQFDLCNGDIREEIREITDWYKAEGRRQGWPDKNSTWLSLKRRSDQWHREVWQREQTEKEELAWTSRLGEIVIDGIKITPLVTALDLYNEGREMRHCVSSYVQWCLSGDRRIFSLKEADGTRSTLSLNIPLDADPFNINDGYTIDQHKGPSNGPVSPAAARAAREVCRLYTRKHLKANEAAEPALTDAA